MLNRLTPRQVEPKAIIAAGTASASVPGKPIIKSDVDELPAIKVKPNKSSYAILEGTINNAGHFIYPYPAILRHLETDRRTREMPEGNTCLQETHALSGNAVEKIKSRRWP
jgi:hypothetical protein